MSYNVVFIGNTHTHIWKNKDYSKAIKIKTDCLNKSHKVVKMLAGRGDVFIASVVPKKTKLFLLASEITYKDILLKRKVKQIKSVGIDRLLNCYIPIETEKDFLVADFGTALSISVVKNNVLQGGFILPGTALAANSLSDQTAKLPLIKIKSSLEFKVGSTTQSAINLGIYWGYYGAIKELYQRTFPKSNAKLFITGGGASLFQKELSKDFNTIYEPDLLKKGFVKTIENSLIK